MRKQIAIVVAIVAGISAYSCGNQKPIDKPKSAATNSNNETRANELMKQFARKDWTATHVPETVTDFATGETQSIRVLGHADKATPKKREPLYSAAEIAASARRDAAKAKKDATK